MLNRDWRSRARRQRAFARSWDERLEERCLPSGGTLGMNVRPEFVDAVKQSSGWQPAPGQSTVTRDAEGWPTSDAELILMDYRVNMPWNGPDPNAVPPDVSGTYRLSFRGRATVAPPFWNPNFQVTNQAYNAATNTTTADVTIPPGAVPFVIMDFTNTQNPSSPTGAGVSDVRLVRPGYDPATTQVFTTNLLSALAPFGPLRTLDAASINDYPVNEAGRLNQLEWSERRLPSEASQQEPYGGKVGVAWEHLIQLANEAQRDLWITIPGPASDDYVTRLANLVAHGETVDGVSYPALAPGLKVYLEYSNEVWGGIWNNRLYNIAAAEQEVAASATAVNNDGVNDSNTWGERRYLERTREITQIFRQVLGPDPTFERIRPVLGWQRGDFSGAGWQYYRRSLTWFESVFGPARETFYGLGVANYWEPDDYASVDSIINGLTRNELTSQADVLKLTTISAYYGVKNVAYEGGPHLSADGNTPAGQNVLAALRDPRMADVVQRHYLNWISAGGDVAEFYAGPYGNWGPAFPWTAAEQYQAANPSLSPKYRGVKAAAESVGVPVTAGYRIDPLFASTFPATVDAMGRSFRKPSTGDDGYWLLNVGAAGSYRVSLSTGSSPGSVPRRISIGGSGPGLGPADSRVDLYANNVLVAASVPVGASGRYTLGDVPLRLGLNTIRVVAARAANDPSAPGDPNRFAFSPVSISIATSPTSGRILHGVTPTSGSLDPSRTGLPVFASSDTSAGLTTTVTPPSPWPARDLRRGRPRIESGRLAR